MQQFAQGERQPLLTGVPVGDAQLAGVVPPGGRCQGLVEGRCGRIRASGELFQLLAVAVHALAEFPGQAVGQAPGLIRGRGLRLIVLMLVPQSGAGADQHQAQQCEQPCRPGQNLVFVPHSFPPGRPVAVLWSRRFGEARGAYWRPLWPKPPSPRALSSNSSTCVSDTCITGTITSCAMRSPGSMVKALLPRFQQDTINWPW